ncbi:hypothetical protein B1218_38040, partial [Pseudomonas ogarae]
TRLSSFNVQPSDIPTAFALLYLAGYLARRQTQARASSMRFFKPLIVLLPQARLLPTPPHFLPSAVTTSAPPPPFFLPGPPRPDPAASTPPSSSHATHQLLRHPATSTHTARVAPSHHPPRRHHTH